MIETRLLAGLALLAAMGPAQALDLTSWSLSPYEADLGNNVTLKVNGAFDGSAYVNDEPRPSLDPSGVTGTGWVGAVLERDYDSGLQLSLNSVFEVYHDRLSVDNYGGDFVQKVYARAQTGLGRIEIGNEDGAAFALAVTGPVVEGFSSIDNSNATYFRDPATGLAFADIFALNSAVESSLNYAKISYYTPRLFGIELAASYTPSEGKDVVPFLNNGPQVANRQKSIWEAAASYNGYFGPVSLNLSAGWSVGHDDNKTAGHAGLTDYSFGGQADYALNDDWKLSLGGAWRHANAYRFDINDVFDIGATTSSHVSATVTHGAWIAGAELGQGSADGSLGEPTLGLHAASATLGYVVNANLQIDLGWEQFLYHRDRGTFYTGLQRIKMNAGFLNFEFKV
ncbi:MAG: hypothetical protein JO261_07025 [Alphaproteobacteria bacterium]|nr:hypothetical protein [Alphaproteobacteria bacterium]MBV9693434.1 hypothetical protein [Alphaproteobacteria bacterium]